MNLTMIADPWDQKLFEIQSSVLAQQRTMHIPPRFVETRSDLYSLQQVANLS